jgi:hypothetical protein
VPLTDADAAAGHWWEISMRQVETSRTIVFTAPRYARGFFEALVADNLDIGRPDPIELIFTGKNERRGRPRNHPLTFKTSVVTRGVDVTVNAFYKHSRIKQYLKDGRALRVETGVPAVLIREVCNREDRIAMLTTGHDHGAPPSNSAGELRDARGLQAQVLESNRR